MKFWKLFGVLLLSSLVIFFGAEFFLGKGEDGVSDAAMYYEERVRTLEGELAALKSEQYVAVAAYREEIKALEALLAESRGVYLYTVKNGEITLTGYTGKEKNVTLPREIDGIPVTAVGKETFKNTAVESVVLHDGIRSIGWFAFSGCRGLKSVFLPSSVAKIEYGCFDGCTSLTISCAKGSFAEKYAKSYGIPYSAN